jgi:hypothetical protein
MRLAEPRAKVRSVERRSVESDDDGVGCRAGRVHREAESSRSALGSLAALLNVVADFLMSLCIDDE